MTSLPRVRSQSATSWSEGVRPARPSTARSTRSTPTSAASTLRLMGLSHSSPDQSPPVSSSRKVRPSSVTTCASLTSRVTPGTSATMASRRPTRRLNRLDLPTLGRPTMATLAKASSSLDGAPVGPVAGVHRALAGRLDALQQHRAAPGRYQQTGLAHFQYGTRLRVVLGLGRHVLPDAHGL